MADHDGGQLAVALEAVLQARQLADIRHMIDLRLPGLSEPTRWRVVTATNELVTNAITHAGGCCGLRIYVGPQDVHVEVDDRSDVRLPPAGPPTSGLGIVALTAYRWGTTTRPTRTVRGEPDEFEVGKTVWFDLQPDIGEETGLGTPR